MEILSLEDDHAQAELIVTSLQAEGHNVWTFSEGRQVIRHLETATVDLLVLDWQVSDISGLDVLGWVRERIGRDLPVLFVTNRSREDEIVTALSAGADDYMIKPVRRRELIARVEALLRRAYPPVNRNETRIAAGAYVVDLLNRIVLRNGEPMDLAPKEFEIAALLFRNLGRTMPREQLVKIIWGRELDKISRSLDTHIYRLRYKLGIGPEHGLRLRAVYTHGYRLERATYDEDDLRPTEH
ncbi:response regulator transcription factor [Trinickia violacea]|uniref:Response regulator transcription factor n=1 Tax=Trinickia violacea TaxID=2571746 RepID=A0A4P8J3J2_9BURK|nr:response regulator transcription factor [Trinickia violacea]QCP54454.1 response regulator transcription factor [Trinickia violacea]